MNITENGLVPLMPSLSLIHQSAAANAAIAGSAEAASSRMTPGPACFVGTCRVALHSRCNV
jgi:hypothetical protein